MQQFLAYGKNGIIEWMTNDPEEFIARFVETPIIQIDIEDACFLQYVGSSNLGINKKGIENCYQKWAKFGPFGDLISGFIIFEHGSYNAYISKIGRLTQQ